MAERRVLITAGPTRAYIDRVRYLSNYSTGELGYLLAKRLSRKGFTVAVVSGPTSQPFDELEGVKFFPVLTAGEMRQVTMRLCREFKPQVAVFAAAVLDFEPETKESGKISSSRKHWTIRLKPTPKIIEDVGKRFPKIKRIGFKLEWDRMGKDAREEFAKQKIRSGNLSGLCLNFLPEISGSKHVAYWFPREGEEKKLSTKKEIAREIAKAIGKF